MRLLGRVLLTPACWLAYLAALFPLLALSVLGMPAAGALTAQPAIVAATLRSLLVAEAALLAGLPVGALAAFGIWRAGRGLRRVVLWGAAITLLLPPALTARGLLNVANGSHLGGAHLAALLTAHAAPCACIALLVFTARLNLLDPAVLRAATLCGAAPLNAFRLTVLPHLGWPTLTAAAAGFALSLGQAAADLWLAPSHHPTLSALLERAVMDRDVLVAPQGLLIAANAVAPLGLMVLLRMQRR